MSARALQRGCAAPGQAMVESAIVLPTLIFAVLGILQLTLLHQARMMLEYAAFSAARAGAVWNADPARMHGAAILALLPTMPSPPLEGAANPCKDGMRVDDPTSLLCRWQWVSGWNPQTAAVLGKPLISVETLSPAREDFGDQKEIDFDQGGDSLADRRRSQLTVRATYFYELRIPIINRAFFESWLAGMGGLGLRGLDPFEPRIASGPALSEARARMAYEWLRLPKEAANCGFSGLGMGHLRRLMALGSALGKWYLPLVTTYTIRMQSNPFLQFAAERPGGCP